jgi:hypothetical protein
MSSMAYIPWKGKVFNILSPSLQPTQDTNTIMGEILFRPRPIKHAYRKEIAVNTTPTGNPRISSSIDALNSPNGFLVYDASSNAIQSCDGWVGTLDDTLPNNQTLLGNTCTVCNVPDECLSTQTSSENTCFSVQLNAQRRVRSSGMIPRKFNSQRNNDSTYFTNNKQYLVSRNRTIEQNNYNFIRQGDPTLQPGVGPSKTNVYSPQGLSHCERVILSTSGNNNVFKYIWLDGVEYTVTIPDDSYDIQSLNQAFQTIMIQNTHYYVNPTSLAKVFLLVFSYNTLYGRVELQALATSSYSLFETGGSWTIVQQVPQFVFSPNALPVLLGISAISFPVNDSFTTTQILVAPRSGALVPPYVQLYYKPSNPQFASQGGVSSSTFTARKVYDAITNSGFAYREAYGASVANAMAYRVMIPGYNVYTFKDQIGYPNKLIPKINTDGSLSKCTPQRFSFLN